MTDKELEDLRKSHNDFIDAFIYKAKSRYVCSCDVSEVTTDKGYQITLYWDEQGNLHDITFDRIH